MFSLKTENVYVSSFHHKAMTTATALAVAAAAAAVTAAAVAVAATAAAALGEATYSVNVCALSALCGTVRTPTTHACEMRYTTSVSERGGDPWPAS